MIDKKIEKLVNGIREFFQVTKGKTAVIGISGGKDSTVAAALLVKALGKENVFGVLMPNGLTSESAYQDLRDGERVCELLGIKYYVFNIHDVYFDILTKVENLLYHQVSKVDDANASQQTKINLAPRIRMSVLYAIAQSLDGGRVINTTNACEKFVGYGTLFGDTAGDLSVLGNVLVSEVCKIGDALDLPHDLVHKTPADGLTGNSDEDVLGVFYSEIETYIKTNGAVPECDWNSCNDYFEGHYSKIRELHKDSQFKRNMICIPTIEC